MVSSPQFLKAGTTLAHFQQSGKEDSVKHLLKSFERIDDSSGQHFFKTIAGMLSGPEAVEEFSFKIARDTKEGVIRISLSWKLVRADKSGELLQIGFRVQLLENIFANNFALSLDD